MPAPAGWYENAHDGPTVVRYWDGREWTHHVRHAPPTAPDPGRERPSSRWHLVALAMLSGPFGGHALRSALRARARSRAGDVSEARRASKEVARWALYGVGLYLVVMAVLTAALVAIVILLELGGLG